MHHSRPLPRGRPRRWLSAALGALCGLALAAFAAVPAWPTDAARGPGDGMASRHAAVAAAAPGAGYAPPLVPFRAVALFDRPARPWLAGHRGIDIVATVGQEVVAPAAGVVTYAGVVVDRPVLTILHDDGRRSSVEPVVAVVEPGQRVSHGDTVGTVAPDAGHCAPHTCVHWGVRRADEYENPLDVLAGYGRIRLLPVGDHRYANAPVRSRATRRRLTAAE